VIKLNINFGRRSISLRELRSHFDHAPEADDHQGLDRYAIGFALEFLLIYFPIVEWYYPDRVRRQFGLLQLVPPLLPEVLYHIY
jgi:hypothetical protein